MAIRTTEALVLRVMDYSETSSIAWVFTQDYGRVHILAKGARRPRSAFEGALEPLVRGELVYYPKRKADALEIASEFDPIERHLGLRTDLGRLYRAVHLAELLTELCEPELPAPDLFAAASRALHELSHIDPKRLELIWLRAVLLFLDCAGLAPLLDVCAATGEALLPDAPAWFCPEAGGALSPEAASQYAADRRRPMDPRTRGALVSVQAGHGVQLDPDLTRSIHEALHAFLTWHLDKPLRSERLLRGL